MVRVLLIAGSPALRAGLRALLLTDPDIQIAAELNRWVALEYRQAEADVVITTSASADMIETNGLRSTGLPTLFLTDERPVGRDSYPVMAAWGALPQECTAGELCAAVHALAEGLIVGTHQLLFEEGEDGAAGHGSPLTEREAEVLEWLAKGLANKQIAAELGISEHTVKFHVSSIYTKLNSTNRTQAVREGLRNGWILL